MAPVKKKFLFVHRKAPYGTFHGRELMDASLMAAAFDQTLSILYLDDGVFMLHKGQQPENIDSQNFSAPLENFSAYGIKNLYADEHSMQQRGLKAGDLLLDVKLLNSEEISELMDGQDIIISY